jgi:hypothetical protein
VITGVDLKGMLWFFTAAEQRRRKAIMDELQEQIQNLKELQLEEYRKQMAV